MTPNGNVRTPSWIWPLVFTVLLGLVGIVWQKTDAKAEDASRRVSEVERIVAVMALDVKYIRDLVKEIRDQQNAANNRSGR